METFKSDFNVTSWIDSPAHLAEEGAIVSMFIFGNLIGALSSSILADKFGRRTTMFVGTILFAFGAVFQVAAMNLWLLYIGRVVSGLAIGLMTMIVPLFNAELAPPLIRGRLITFNQIAMTGGIMVSYWVNYGLQDIQNGWRYALSGQLLLAAVLICGLFCVPKSPRWLVQQGKHDDALTSLKRLRCDDEVANDELEQIIKLRMREKEQTIDTWGALFCDPVSRKRLIICATLQSFQQLTVCMNA